jgi:hypothetical protein
MPEQTPSLSPPKRSVSGQVTTLVADTSADSASMSHSAIQDGFGLEGVIITSEEGQAIQTGADGEFILQGLAPGEHTITPRKEGYSFAPPSINVNLSAGDFSGLTFVGSSGPAGSSLSFSLHLPLILPNR